MSDQISFEALPPGRQGVARISHAVIAAQLRERPGEWAWICTRSTAKLAAGTAHSIRLGHGLRHYAPSGAFEATARTVVEEVDGKKKAVHKVFARFVGQKEESDD